jgi:hypothetical protein
MILFLNKKDLFIKKIKRVPLQDFFLAYKDFAEENGGLTEETAQRFVEELVSVRRASSDPGQRSSRSPCSLSRPQARTSGSSTSTGRVQPIPMPCGCVHACAGQCGAAQCNRSLTAALLRWCSTL